MAQNIFPANGNVGIGTNNPYSLLDVRRVLNVNEIAFTNTDGGDDSDPYRLRKVRASMDQNWLELQLNDNTNESFRIYGNSCESDGCSAYSSKMYHLFDASGNVFHQGNLGLGIMNPSEKLAVNGNIRAKEIKVEVNNWPDYVFAVDYKLPSLKSLSAYIKDNQRLSEVPSARDTAENGISLGEMNKILLKKIEELTLHIIELSEKVEKLETNIK